MWIWWVLFGVTAVFLVVLLTIVVGALLYRRYGKRDPEVDIELDYESSRLDVSLDLSNPEEAVQQVRAHLMERSKISEDRADRLAREAVGMAQMEILPDRWEEELDEMEPHDFK